MSSFATIRASNANFTRSFTQRPVAVFVGGTSGIGEAMAQVFMEHTQGNSDIVIVGRNRSAAERVLASIIPSASSGAREFIQCDMTLMKNVEDSTKEILRRYTKINYLIMTPGILTLSGRDETEEGIDKKLAVHYYGRWKFLGDLLPALTKAQDEGEKGAVVSVLAAGRGGVINLDDLGLKTTYSVTKAASVAPTYNDLMMEQYATKAPNLTLIHAYPGGVRTPLIAASPSTFLRAIGPLVMTITRPFTVSPQECAEYMWNAVFITTNAPGAFRTDSRGGDMGKKNYHGSEEQRKALWEHTENTIQAALASHK